MNIKQHKALVGAIPDDLVNAEKIEVSDDGEHWHKAKFHSWTGSIEIRCELGMRWKYARRPAPALKRLKDEPWPIHKSSRYRAVDADGRAGYYFSEPYPCGDKWSSGNGWFNEEDTEGPIRGRLFDASDWQNSLEERPDRAEAREALKDILSRGKTAKEKRRPFC